MKPCPSNCHSGEDTFCGDCGRKFVTVDPETVSSMEVRQRNLEGVISSLNATIRDANKEAAQWHHENVLLRQVLNSRRAEIIRLGNLIDVYESMIPMEKTLTRNPDICHLCWSTKPDCRCTVVEPANP